MSATGPQEAVGVAATLTAQAPSVDDREFIRVEDLAKGYGGPDVFEQVNFSVAKGEVVCLIGHSGCGKTTILNALAGLEQPGRGRILVGGREVKGPSLDRAVVFQSHALLPWMTALENVAFAVRSRHPELAPAARRERALKALSLVGLAAAADKRPAQLSGGMKQRVGIARALSIEPQVLLLDEPFSALDALTRGTLQDEVLRIVHETDQTVFLITHDVDEAILLADKILLMTNGPHATLAEIVVNTLPRNRSRHDVHKHPHYYRIRNHLIEYLVDRAPTFDRSAPGYDPRRPPLISPGTTPTAGDER
jgi:nitrate/nitrite transport system ATP-binding protein